MDSLRALRIRSVWLLVLAVMGLVLAGCATTEPDNLSERPWNAPKSWEHGFPTGMFEGR